MTVSLKNLNTLGVDCEADRLDIVRSVEELQSTLEDCLASSEHLTVLGGGSNVVPLRRIAGCVVLMRDDAFRVVEEDANSVLVEIGAGHDWNAFVQKTLLRGWCGLENLILIPGTVGAAPMQNIGAYGVELADRLHSVIAVDRVRGETREFVGKDCGFGYRTSLFKQAGQWIIARIRLRLFKSPNLVLDYPDVARNMQGRAHTAVEVADVVAAIRRQKLPDPTAIGNVGSFFKNPVIALEMAESLRTRISDLHTYPADESGLLLKLSAAQLIDRAGWKGRCEDGVAVWEKQPLVLVNRGATRGSAFLALAEKIRTDLLDRYGVALELEPVVLGQD